MDDQGVGQAVPEGIREHDDAVPEPISSMMTTISRHVFGGFFRQWSSFFSGIYYTTYCQVIFVKRARSDDDDAACMTPCDAACHDLNDR